MTTTVKIRYRIDVIGWHTSYLADYHAPESPEYTCTRDMPNSFGVYQPLAYRRFECLHIVTWMSSPMEIEVAVAQERLLQEPTK